MLVWSANPYYQSSEPRFPELTVSVENNAPVNTLLSDPRMDEIFRVGREMNELRSKIGAATDYIRKAQAETDLEDIVLAREALKKELNNNAIHVRTLTPVIEEMIIRFEGEVRSLKERQKLHAGLAKIEEMAGTKPMSSGYETAAAGDKAQIAELTNLIGALDELEMDLTTRKDPVTCPRCASNDIRYMITPSDLGFTLYKCTSCTNGWRIQRFVMKPG